MLLTSFQATPCGERQVQFCGSFFSSQYFFWSVLLSPQLAMRQPWLHGVPEATSPDWRDVCDIKVLQVTDFHKVVEAGRNWEVKERCNLLP